MKAMSNKPLNLFLESILTLSWDSWAYIIRNWEILILAKGKALASVTTSSLDRQWTTHVMNMFLLFLICKTEDLSSITALLFMDSRFSWFFKWSRGLLSLGRGQLMDGQTTETRSMAPVGERDRIQGQDISGVYMLPGRADAASICSLMPPEWFCQEGDEWPTLLGKRTSSKGPLVHQDKV